MNVNIKSSNNLETYTFDLLEESVTSTIQKKLDEISSMRDYATYFVPYEVDHVLIERLHNPSCTSTIVSDINASPTINERMICKNLKRIRVDYGNGVLFVGEYLTEADAYALKDLVIAGEGRVWCVVVSYHNGLNDHATKEWTTIDADNGTSVSCAAALAAFHALISLYCSPTVIHMLCKYHMSECCL